MVLLLLLLFSPLFILGVILGFPESSLAEKRPLLLVPGWGGTKLEFAGDDGNSFLVWGNWSDNSNNLVLEYLICDMFITEKHDECLAHNHQGTIQPPNNSRTEEEEEEDGGLSNVWGTVATNGDSYFYFHPLIQKLVGKGYVPGESLFAFGYDWRKSFNQNAHALHSFLSKRGWHELDIVAMDIGALIVEHYLSLYGNLPSPPSPPPKEEVEEKNRMETSPKINNFVTISAPWNGEPIRWVLDLLNGPTYPSEYSHFSSFLGSYIEPFTLHHLFISSPYYYDLLARTERGYLRKSFEDPNPPFSKKTPSLMVSTVEIADFDTMLLEVVVRANEGKTIVWKDGSEGVLEFDHILFDKSRAALLNVEKKLLRGAEKKLRSLVRIQGELVPTLNSLRLFGVSLNSSFAIPDGSRVSGDGAFPTSSLHYESISSNLVPIIIPNVEHKDIFTDEATIGVVEYVLGVGCRWEGDWNFSYLTWNFDLHFVQEGFNVHALSGIEDSSGGCVTLTGYSSSHLLDGEIDFGDDHATLHLILGTDCLTISGTLRFSTSVNEVPVSGVRAIGYDCVHNDLRQCLVDNGHGFQQCHFGTWGSECREIECDYSKVKILPDYSVTCSAKHSNLYAAQIFTLVICMMLSLFVFSFSCFQKYKKKKKKNQAMDQIYAMEASVDDL